MKTKNNKKRCKNNKSPNFVWGLNKKTAIQYLQNERESYIFSAMRADIFINISYKDAQFFYI